MFRKIILVIATFALVCVAFAIYVWREDTGPRSRIRPQPVSRQPVASRPAAASRPADQHPTFTYQWAKIPPGQAPKVRVYDPRTGEVRISFQATQWDPISDTEFHLKKPSACVRLPGGQLAYVRADEGQIKVDTSDTRNPNPKSGWFKGNVEIFIDRTRPEWRQQHPDLAAPEQHPEAIVKIWLEDAHFDLDLARLESQGSVLVQSSQGSLEGRGLELIWSEADRRLHKLCIKEGKRAVIRGMGPSEGGTLAGGSARTPEEGEPTGLFAPIGLPGLVAAQGGEPTPAAPPAGGESAAELAAPTSQPAEADRQGQIAFLDQQSYRARKNQIDTYHLVFRDNVEARQIQGAKTVGSLKADVLTLLSDVGREERASVAYTPGMSASGGRQAGSTTTPATSGPDDSRRKRRDLTAENQSVIEMAWTGEVLVEPVPPTSTQQEEPIGSNKRRFHLRAEGNPVDMVDAQQGRVTCRTFEYHLESKQGWLTGTPQEPVVLNAGPDRQVVVERALFFDQTAGIARINGPGRMIGRRGELDLGGAIGQSAKPSPAGHLTDESADVQVAWKGSGQIVFDRMASSKRSSSGKGPSEKQSAYLKEAEFNGGVQADTTGQAISGDRIHVTFLPPPAKPSGPARPKAASPLMAGELVGGTAANHITATGSVRMSQRTMRIQRQEKRETTESVACDRLEIEMALDDTGRNYTRLGQAFGHVLARQVVQSYLGASRMGSPLVRDIRADDEITIEMASVPRQITEAPVEKLEAHVRQLGLAPESAQTKGKELRGRRDLVRKRLVARGNVSAHDAQQDLKNLLGQSLECTFDDQQRIDKALLVGGPDSTARVEHGDFDIHGQRLSLNMATETVEVPGKGLLRFYSDQDIDGRRVEEKIPVVVTWERQMWLRGSENTGSFEGNVSVTSENNRMEARELRLKFTAASATPAASAPAAPPAQQWVVSRLIDAFRAEKPKNEPGSLTPQRNRRLARADAFGDVVIKSSSYRPADDTPAYRLALALRDRTPAFLRPPGAQPVEPDKHRLLSCIHLTGPQVRIDLLESQMIVEGEGKLLIEDYRIPPPSSSRREASAAGLSSSLVPDMDSLGPSQTLFTWENAMTFLSKDNLAKFDRNVTMRHSSGTYMALFGQLKSALKLDEATIKRLTSRTATLTCDNLLAQFETVRSRDTHTGPSPLSQATGLKKFWARRNVELVDLDAKVHRSARGSLIDYDGQSGDAKITGSEQQPVVMQAVNPSTGQLILNRRGQEVTWNLKTGQVFMQKSIILAPGR